MQRQHDRAWRAAVGGVDADQLGNIYVSAVNSDNAFELQRPLLAPLLQPAALAILVAGLGAIGWRRLC